MSFCRGGRFGIVFAAIFAHIENVSFIRTSGTYRRLLVGVSFHIGILILSRIAAVRACIQRIPSLGTRCRNFFRRITMHAPVVRAGAHSETATEYNRAQYRHNTQRHPPHFHFSFRHYFSPFIVRSFSLSPCFARQEGCVVPFRITSRQTAVFLPRYSSGTFRLRRTALSAYLRA